MRSLFGVYDDFFATEFHLQECIYGMHDICLVSGAEDRFKEAVYFASQMEAGYHDPQKFRYALGAFLSSYGSLAEILQKELEQQDLWQKWKVHRETIPNGLIANEYQKALTRARNINIHQKSVFAGSYCQLGLFRGRKQKVGIGTPVDWDTSSPALVSFFRTSDLGKIMLDEQHSAIGEQYGVMRIYKLAQVSKELPAGEEDLDVLRIVHRALVRTYDTIGFTHTMDGDRVGLISGERLLGSSHYSNVTVLLESDVDPGLPYKWGWSVEGEEPHAIANF